MFTVTDYATIRAGHERSAATIVPDIMRFLQPQSVTDYGCGEGIWLAEFARHGCEILGVDNDRGQLVIRPDQFHQLDLVRAKDPLLPTTDLVVCLETAQRLPPERADWLVDVLCGTSQVVLFSAAIPGQGGHGHVNEQWPGYWYNKFEERCYQGTGWLRWRYWDRVPYCVAPSYAQSLFLYAEEEWLQDHPDRAELWDTDLGGPLPIVHPATWTTRLGLVRTGAGS